LFRLDVIRGGKRRCRFGERGSVRGVARSGSTVFDWLAHRIDGSKATLFGTVAHRISNAMPKMEM
jgi:hypothetical protein